MQKISHDAVSELLTNQAAPETGARVTMYIPMETTASPPHITENQIRFKNLIHKAAEELKSRGDQTKLSDELCALIDTYSDDMDFWKDQGKGLLLCAAPGMVRMYCLPVDTEEYVAVDDAFHLAPVLALLSDAREYYVLALAQQHPKVFKGDMYGITELEGILPSSLQDSLRLDEFNQETERQGSATGSSMSTGWFNGRGGAHDQGEADRAKYFHILDKQLLAELDHKLPLILAGADAEVAAFRGLSKYPSMLLGTIIGNHTETNPQALYEKALDIVRAELVKPEHDAFVDEYQRVSGANPERVAHTNASILEAADQGRIDKLLAMMSRHTTDTVQDKVESVFRITFPEPGHSKMLNNLAAKVWQMKGKVVSLLPDEIPKGEMPSQMVKGGAPMVARLRY